MKNRPVLANSLSVTTTPRSRLCLLRAAHAAFALLLVACSAAAPQTLELSLDPDASAERTPPCDPAAQDTSSCPTQETSSWPPSLGVGVCTLLGAAAGAPLSFEFRDMDGNSMGAARSAPRCVVTRAGSSLRVTIAQEVCPACPGASGPAIALSRTVPCDVEPLPAGHYDIDLGPGVVVPLDVTAEGTTTACALRSGYEASPYATDCVQDADCAMTAAGACGCCEVHATRADQVAQLEADSEQLQTSCVSPRPSCTNVDCGPPRTASCYDGRCEPTRTY